MTTAATTQPVPVQDPFLQSLNKAVGSGLITGLAALVFTPIPFFGGALFGATSTMSNYFFNAILDKAGCNPESTLGKTLKTASTWLASIGIAAGIATLAGFPITFPAGVVLSIAAVATGCALGCLCVGATGCCALGLAGVTGAFAGTKA